MTGTLVVLTALLLTDAAHAGAHSGSRLFAGQLVRQGEPSVPPAVPQTTRATRAMMLQGEQHLEAPDEELALYARALLTNHSYADHVEKDGGLGLAIALDATVRRHITAGLALRTTAFEAELEGSDTGFAESEFWGSVGWTERAWALNVVLAGIDDDDDETDLDTTVLGLRYRYSAVLGDARLEASLSLYDDQNVLRLAPTWRVPVTQRLWIEPGIALQLADEGYLSGAFRLGYDLDSVRMSAGVHYGDQFRPAALGTMSVHNYAEVVSHGADLEIAVPIGAPWTLLAGYAWRHLRADAHESDGVIIDNQTSDAHVLTVGVGYSY